MSFPPLPPLDDLDDFLNNDVKDKPKKINNSQANFNVSSGLPQLENNDDISFNEELNIKENIIEKNTLLNDEEEFENDSEFIDLEGDFEDNNDFEIDELSLQDEFEEEFEDILPLINIDEENIDEGNINENKKKKPTVQVKVNLKTKDFREIDEEAIKEFFANIKNKILDIKDELFNSEKEKELNKKQPKSSKSSKNNKVMTNVFKGLKIIGALILILGIIFTVISFFNKPSSNAITELNHEIKTEQGMLFINNIERYGDGIDLTIQDERNISTSFFIDIEFMVKTSLFKKETFICQSDIIFLETNKEVKESMKCDNFIEADKYEMKVNFNEIK